ncbi:acetyltransferase [Pragia fontium]|uniref:Acetyltransferase n=1 Tax=Pragia fontium TaxID=82985 RepID=A0ABQ5LE79_9GAMM|nr:GNAT family N-acetyltransferase [Pragia fontium]AKJ42042.1 acetyltransferase [Pragia fontium]GKX61926.1 acetyltransferase [Pragia fontium]
MDKIEIHAVKEKDYPELTALWERSVRATHDFLPEADILFFRPLILNEFLPMVHLMCTKNSQGAISGFIGVADNKVEMLFIDPAYRGQGLGKALLNYGIEQLAITEVDVNEQNPQALNFYLKCGFNIAGRSEVDGMGKPYPLLHLILQ